MGGDTFRAATVVTAAGSNYPVTYRCDFPDANGCRRVPPGWSGQGVWRRKSAVKGVIAGGRRLTRTPGRQISAVPAPVAATARSDRLTCRLPSYRRWS